MSAKKCRPMRHCFRCGEWTPTDYCKPCQDVIKKPPFVPRAPVGTMREWSERGGRHYAD